MLSQKQLKRFFFDTVADMQAANLRDGEIAFVAEVNGFYKSDGSSVELINSSGSFEVEDQVDFTTAEPGAPSTGDRYINTTTGTSSGTAARATTGGLSIGIRRLTGCLSTSTSAASSMRYST